MNLDLLIVDDDRLGGESLAELFRARGAHAEWAASAEEALARARGRRFGAVVIDHFLPGLDGLGLAAELRRRPATAGAPCVLLTAAADAEFAALEAALSALPPALALRKPCDAGEVLSAIESLLEGKS